MSYVQPNHISCHLPGLWILPNNTIIHHSKLYNQSKYAQHLDLHFCQSISFLFPVMPHFTPCLSISIENLMSRICTVIFHGHSHENITPSFCPFNSIQISNDIQILIIQAWTKSCSSCLENNATRKVLLVHLTCLMGDL